jgi:hypothetical protein
VEHDTVILDLRTLLPQEHPVLMAVLEQVMAGID